MLPLALALALAPAELTPEHSKTRFEGFRVHGEAARPALTASMS